MTRASRPRLPPETRATISQPIKKRGCFAKVNPVQWEECPLVLPKVCGDCDRSYFFLAADCPYINCKVTIAGLFGFAGTR